MLVKDLLEVHRADLTPAERKLVPFLQDESLVIEFQSITKLADAADVSTPTIIRLARKLGFDGFPTLQKAIRDEVAERIKQPLAKLEAQVPAGRDDHLVHGFAQKVMENFISDLSQLEKIIRIIPESPELRNTRVMSAAPPIKFKSITALEMLIPHIGRHLSQAESLLSGGNVEKQAKLKNEDLIFPGRD